MRFLDDKVVIYKTQEELQDIENRLVDTGSKYGMEISIKIIIITHNETI